MAVDYAPLLVFFAVNFLAPAEPMRQLVAAFTPFLSDIDRVAALVIARVICATTAFMLATIAAIVVSRVKLGHVSPMLWISGALVVVFGFYPNLILDLTGPSVQLLIARITGA